MFAAKKDSSNHFVAPEPSAAAIAAGVAKGAKHRSLDARIAELTAERETVIAQMRAFIAGNSSELNDAQIRKLQKTRETIEDNLRPLRMQLRPHRDEYSERVRTALKPQIEAAARAMLHGLAEFAAAVAVLNSCETEIGRAGSIACRDRLEMRRYAGAWA